MINKSEALNPKHETNPNDPNPKWGKFLCFGHLDLEFV